MADLSFFFEYHLNDEIKIHGRFYLDKPTETAYFSHMAGKFHFLWLYTITTQKYGANAARVHAKCGEWLHIGTEWYVLSSGR